MALRKTIKSVAKRVYAKGKRAFKKRYVKRGGPNVANIYKDVMMLKSLVNVEKKRFDTTSAGPLTIGQTAGVGVSGGVCVNVSPAIAEGITGSTRNGLSFKIVSCCLDMYFNQSVNATNAVKIKWYMIMKKDNGVDTTNAQAYAQFLEPNPFSNVIDYHSSRDPEFFTAYRVMKSGVVNLQQDSITSQIAYAQRKIPLKLNFHQKFNSDVSTITTKNKVFMIFVLDTGDAVALTGAQVQYNLRWYYTDN